MHLLPPSTDAAAGWVPQVLTFVTLDEGTPERLFKYLAVDDLTQLTVKIENIPGGDCMKET